jgi:hypothetical protein
MSSTQQEMALTLIVRMQLNMSATHHTLSATTRCRHHRMPFWKAAAANALRNGELMKGSSQEGPGLSSWSRSSGISTSPDTSDNTWRWKVT